MALRLIISPAKKLVPSPDWVPRGQPPFLDEARQLTAALRAMGRDELQKLWSTSDALTATAMGHLATWAPRGSDAAVMSYQGIQYTALAPQVMDEGQLAWTASHLRILSGLYGVLRPFDAVAPYRLEMQAKLAGPWGRDVYAFWGDRLARALADELRAEPGVPTLVNVASVEYAKAVLPHLSSDTNVVTCLFGEIREGKLRQPATEAKRARGMFCRWCAERDVEDADQLAGFSEAGYALDPALSTEGELVFVRPAPARSVRRRRG